MKLVLRLIVPVLGVAAVATCGEPTEPGSDDAAVEGTIHQYVLDFLDRNPVTSTYLGGAALDPAIADTDGRLRDHSVEAITREDEELSTTLEALEAVDASALSRRLRIDREVAMAQIRFLLNQHQVRRYQERAVDTYVEEAMRGIDWQIQGMTRTGEETYGTGEEWTRVAERLEGVPEYLATAREQILAGVTSGNTPDYRMIRENGIEASRASEVYLAGAFIDLVEARVTGPDRESVVANVAEAARGAAEAYGEFGRFLAETFFDEHEAPGDEGVKSEFRGDRYVLGEEQYDWAVRNNFRIDKTAAELFEEAWPIVEATQGEMYDLAREIGDANGWDLPDDGPAAVRSVMDRLSEEFPATDVEMIEWYRETAARLVDYGGRSGLFDVPEDYQLEITFTPPPLRASVAGAVYYPAPAFKESGVGRFYLTPTGDDEAALRARNRASMADLAVHEGFPGHDWHFKVMTEFRDEISVVRWLTPGAVEDSSSKWMDSMALEGWALYSEALMAEPQPGYPHGFYSPGERLYQLQGKLYRDLRVRIDTGIHTGRMTFDEAVDLFSEVVDFLPGSCSADPSTMSAAKRASCDDSWKAIYRYSKWPTQAITYRLGKDQIQELRQRASERVGERFSPKAFHMLFMKQGSIPPGYFADELLREIAGEE